MRDNRFRKGIKEKEMKNEIKKYVQKTYPIEAIQFDGTYNSMESIESIFPEMRTTSASYNKGNNTVIRWSIDTLSERKHIDENDWVIKDHSGNFHSCPDKIFNKGYVLLNEL